MKSAEEWAIERNEMDLYHMQAASNDECMAEFAMFLQQIQLDAMKEGMRRAAEIARWKHPISSSAAHYEAKRTTESILTTAEQLTIKDLEV